jgi:hypothetical protein
MMKVSNNDLIVEMVGTSFTLLQCRPETQLTHTSIFIFLSLFRFVFDHQSENSTWKKQTRSEAQEAVLVQE